VSTRQRRIAELARQHPDRVFTSLNHYLDLDWLYQAYELTRKDGAPGIDGVTAKEYERELRSNLASLLEGMKSGTYRASAVRRTYIPKDDGTQRPLGIPTFEDKVAQRAVVMLLEPIYEQDFRDCSYGFRPERSAHQALERLRDDIMERSGKWILDMDVSNYFGTIDHNRLREALDKRVKDGVIRRLIDKWLKAGVLEDGTLSIAEEGTPQGGVISPLLANIFLHEVLDRWFQDIVIPRLRGRSSIVRFADDAVGVFENREDCERVREVMAKRLAKYGLTLHPTKTRIVDFRFLRQRDKQSGEHTASSFDFLGFTHVWKRSRRGSWVVTRKTMKKRHARALRRVYLYCRRHRHDPIREQHGRLSSMLLGHFAYYGITGNSECIRNFAHQVNRVWHKWLQRKRYYSRFHDPRVLHVFLPSARRMSWNRFSGPLRRFMPSGPRAAKCWPSGTE
jgi:group II intron reverse transcriptase/maturase